MPCAANQHLLLLVLASYWLKHAHLSGHRFIKLAADNWQDGESGEGKSKERSGGHTEKLVEEVEVGLAVEDQPAVGVADEDPSKDDAEDESDNVRSGDEGLGHNDDLAGDESVPGVLETGSHEDTQAVHWA